MNLSFSAQQHQENSCKTKGPWGFCWRENDERLRNIKYQQREKNELCMDEIFDDIGINSKNFMLVD